MPVYTPVRRQRTPTHAKIAGAIEALLTGYQSGRERRRKEALEERKVGVLEYEAGLEARRAAATEGQLEVSQARESRLRDQEYARNYWNWVKQNNAEDTIELRRDYYDKLFARWTDLGEAAGEDRAERRRKIDAEIDNIKSLIAERGEPTAPRTSAGEREYERDITSQLELPPEKSALGGVIFPALRALTGKGWNPEAVDAWAEVEKAITREWEDQYGEEKLSPTARRDLLRYAVKNWRAYTSAVPPAAIPPLYTSEAEPTAATTLPAEPARETTADADAKFEAFLRQFGGE